MLRRSGQSKNQWWFKILNKDANPLRDDDHERNCYLDSYYLCSPLFLR